MPGRCNFVVFVVVVVFVIATYAPDKEYIHAVVDQIV